MGGPAKVAVLASGFFGTISGSSVANTVSTGTFTIPLMKSVGYRGAFAGAVEAASSTGGQIMPPIMGAAAFIMAQFLGVGYVEIAKAALIPALLYYLAVGFMVHMEAKRWASRVFPRNACRAPGSCCARAAICSFPFLCSSICLFRLYAAQVGLLLHSGDRDHFPGGQ